MNASYTLSRGPIIRGEIYYVMPKNTEEDAVTLNTGGRPAIIVSNDMLNQTNGYVSVVYMSRTKSYTRHLPTDVIINSAMEESVAICSEVYTVPRARIGKFVNQVTENELKQIEKALAITFSAPVDTRTVKESVELYNKWQKFLENKMESVAVCEESNMITSNTETQPIITQPTVIQDITLTPEYIKLETERDIYKNLYTELLKDRLG